MRMRWTLILILLVLAVGCARSYERDVDARNLEWTAFRGDAQLGADVDCPGNAGVRREGCMAARMICVKMNDSIITSADDLRHAVAPVENADQAANVALLTQPDLGGVLRTAQAPDGFFVEVILRNTCGCGVHKPTRALLLVHRSGDISPVIEEPLPKMSLFSKQACVD
jgi:hypothetical protein